MSVPQPFAERDYYGDPRRRAKSLAVRAISRLTRPLGIDVELRHWYSPIPQIEAISPAVWSGPGEMPGVEPFDTAEMLDFLDAELAGAVAEFEPPRAWSGRQNDYFLENGLFQAVDSDVLFAMIRRFKPSRVIEIGAGFSTLVAAAACAANRRDGDAVRFESYDPYAVRPAPGQVHGLDELHPVRAEDIPMETFDALTEGDVLFIDSSHTVRIGGDVVHLFNDILPRLRPGVLVHVHDIYLPWPYPREWITRNRWYWAEQYLLQSFLAFNPRFEVLWSSYAVWRTTPDRLRRAVPNLRSGDPAPLSFWMRVAP